MTALRLLEMMDAKVSIVELSISVWMLVVWMACWFSVTNIFQQVFIFFILVEHAHTLQAFHHDFVGVLNAVVK